MYFLLLTLTSRWRSWSSSVGLISSGRIWLKSGPAPKSRALSAGDREKKGAAGQDKEPQSQAVDLVEQQACAKSSAYRLQAEARHALASKPTNSHIAAQPRRNALLPPRQARPGQLPNADAVRATPCQPAHPLHTGKLAQGRLALRRRAVLDLEQQLQEEGHRRRARLGSQLRQQQHL